MARQEELYCSSYQAIPLSSSSSILRWRKEKDKDSDEAHFLTYFIGQKIINEAAYNDLNEKWEHDKSDDDKENRKTFFPIYRA